LTHKIAFYIIQALINSPINSMEAEMHRVGVYETQMAGINVVVITC